MSQFNPDSHNVGGQYLLLKHMNFHNKAIHNAKSNIQMTNENNRSPFKGKQQPKNKKFAQRNQHKSYEEMEHEKRLKLLHQKITKPKTMGDRKKDIYDAKVYPVQIKHSPQKIIVSNGLQIIGKKPGRNSVNSHSSSTEFYNINRVSGGVRKVLNNRIHSSADAVDLQKAEIDFYKFNTGDQLRSALMGRILKDSLFKDDEFIRVMDEAFKDAINVTNTGKRRAFLSIIREYDVNVELSRWFDESGFDKYKIHKKGGRKSNMHNKRKKNTYETENDQLNLEIIETSNGDNTFPATYSLKNDSNSINENHVVNNQKIKANNTNTNIDEFSGIVANKENVSDDEIHHYDDIDNEHLDLNRSVEFNVDFTCILRKNQEEEEENTKINKDEVAFVSYDSDVEMNGKNIVVIDESVAKNSLEAELKKGMEIIDVETAFKTVDDGNIDFSKNEYVKEANSDEDNHDDDFDEEFVDDFNEEFEDDY
eukprot:TRINITY_DN1387_c0_g1_i1.p1 TRINITY_DN1387_c0_g1~~TRINITY_DN1387_c0_g1_i1.p1  ORF type:complete len:479 (+),score=161.27 TRINITY_DN1387_c0_g1_i1:46-1482(+)